MTRMLFPNAVAKHIPPFTTVRSLHYEIEVVAPTLVLLTPLCVSRSLFFDQKIEDIPYDWHWLGAGRIWSIYAPRALALKKLLKQDE